MLPSRHRQLVKELEYAIHNDQLKVAYQPIVEMNGEKIVAYEALCRWAHPTVGEVAPDVFIPAAEKSGLINCLGLTVLKQAARVAATLPTDVSIAVNLSPKQLEFPSMMERLLEIIIQHGLSPSRFDFEVTETTVLKCNETTIGNLRVLQDAGCRVSLDDFGTGYSSLSHLRLSLFDTIKIDKSFVREIAPSTGGAAMVGALIAFAKALALEVTAEGVEDAETAAFLKEHGCNFGQGFHFGKPKLHHFDNDGVVGNLRQSVVENSKPKKDFWARFKCRLP